MVVIDNLSKSDVQLLNLTISIYKIFGLAPISLTEHPMIRNHKKEVSVEFALSLSTLIINSIGLLILLPVEVFYLYERFAADVHDGVKSHLNYHFDIFFRINVVLTQIILILIFSFKRKQIVAILNELLSFESELVKNLSDLDQLHSGQHQQLVVFIVYLLISMILIFNKLLIDDTLQATVNVIPKFIIRNLMIQYTILLIFIKKKYYSLNESLIVLTNRSDQLCYPFISIFDAPSEDIVLDYLAFIRKSYFRLTDIVNSVKQFYSVPMLVSLVYYCLGAVYVGYLFVSSVLDYLIDKTGVVECVDNGLLFIMCIYPTIVLTNLVTSIIAEIKRTVNIVYQLTSVYSTHTGITYELEQFSMELLHQDVSFTAFEMVPLDNSQLTSVFSMMLTYIIILLQSDDRERPIHQKRL